MNPYNTINIILADDHEIFRDGFRTLIEEESGIKLVAEAADGYTLLSMVDRYQPDIVLTDIKMPGLDGIQATEILTRKYPQLGVIALSMFNDDYLIIDMLVAGVKGFLLKDAGKKPIIEAIRTVSKNDYYFCQSTALSRSRLIANGIYDPERNERKAKLSEREIQVLSLLCQQKTNREIAEELSISLRTVEGFRLKLLAKTNAANLIGLYVFAVRYGILHNEK